MYGMQPIIGSRARRSTPSTAREFQFQTIFIQEDLTVRVDFHVFSSHYKELKHALEEASKHHKIHVGGTTGFVFRYTSPKIESKI